LLGLRDSDFTASYSSIVFLLSISVIWTVLQPQQFYLIYPMTPCHWRNVI